MTTGGVIVFLGPSMPLEHARLILDAEYRRPVRRGDLAAIEPGAVVAMIDGVFDQDLAVSLREVHDAVARGVVVFGGASMGALRAAEAPGVIGVGRIFEWYRDGVIRRDDEVALLFSEESGQALTVPSVNIRFAAERLCRMGTIDAATAESLVAAALAIPFKERTHEAVLEAVGLNGRADSADLIDMLKAHDLKYRDAQAVLEAVDRRLQDRNHRQPAADLNSTQDASRREAEPHPQPQHNDALIWESGDRVSHEDLLEFLVYTGRLEAHASRFVGSLPDARRTGSPEVNAKSIQQVFDSAARRWGWMSSEEARVTIGDLGLDLPLIDASCAREAENRERAAWLLRDARPEVRRALLSDLFLDGLALKRETMRLGAVRALALQSPEDPALEDQREAETVLCKANGDFGFAAVRQRWAALGYSAEARQDRFVRLLARARRAGREFARVMRCSSVEPLHFAAAAKHFGLVSRPKPVGESRFCLASPEAEAHARRIGQAIGVTRISMIGELGDLGGIQVAQAARPGNAWSSSYGSGKSRTAVGAVVGSIMEETEKWAQEQFHPRVEAIEATYEVLATNGNCVDPATLDLPYDSVYQPRMRLHWYPCFDLLTGETIYVPADVLDIRRGRHDICYTQRGVRKHLATNGLGCGFSLEEAILHALCEYVERHAQRMAELLLNNPGGLGPHPYRFVDLSRWPAAVQDIGGRLRSRGYLVRVLDITSEVRIPTFFASITRELQRADGYGTHPDPGVAIEMALLEAAQTIASATAGGREDLSIHARSLGRHERPRPVSVDDAWLWLDPDPEFQPTGAIDGLNSTDVYDELQWCLGRLRRSGVRRALVANLTRPEIEPAFVVRVILPGLETNNPFYTGPRARMLLVRDLLPRWQ